MIVIGELHHVGLYLFMLLVINAVVVWDCRWWRTHWTFRTVLCHW